MPLITSPLYSNEQRLNTLASVTKEAVTFWQAAAQARKDFDTGDYHGPYAEPTNDRFIEWFKNTYGVQLKRIDTGELKLDYTVVDESKYTMFLLKYTK